MITSRELGRRGADTALELIEIEFADDPEALAVNITLLLGVAARFSDPGDIHGQDTIELLGVPSQELYTTILERVVEAGHYADVNTSENSVFLFLFEALGQKYSRRAKLKNEDTGQNESQIEFIPELQSVIDQRHQIYTLGVKLKKPSRHKLRLLKKDILELSEDIFIESTRHEASQIIPINLSRFNRDIILHFCNGEYWQHYLDSIDHAEETGDMAELNRLERIRRPFIFWVRDQYKHILQQNDF